MPSEATATRTDKANVFDIVTQRIIEALERGTVPWRKEWDDPRFQTPRNLNTGKAYQGINFFLLSLGDERFSSPYWLTFKQARERGGSVRKGEKGSPVFFWKVYDRDTGEEPIEAEARGNSCRFVARYYTVFNVEQCDGLDHPQAEVTTRNVPVIDRCEQVVSSYTDSPEVRYGGKVASYSPIGDVVHMPDRSSFHSPESFYSTVFHELTHSTGHPKRLARFTADQPPAPFGTPDYSREELVAELGAAFLCARTAISNATIDNSAAYIAGWVRVLKTDSRAVVLAAAAARKAVELIAGAEDQV